MICIQQNLTDNFDEKSFNGTRKKKNVHSNIFSGRGHPRDTSSGSLVRAVEM